MTELKALRPRVQNSPLVDPDVYAARQRRLFLAGRFGFRDVAELTADDQVFLELGSGPARTVDGAGPTVGPGDVVDTWVEFRPDGLDPAEWPSGLRFANDERVFARRPSNDPKDKGLNGVALELPADLGPDGKPVDPPSRLTRRALLILAGEKARGLRPRPTTLAGM